MDFLAEVVEEEVGEIGNEHPAGIIFRFEVGNVGEGLLGGEGEVGDLRGFHLYEELAWPEEVYATLALVFPCDSVFMEGINGVAVASEDFKKIIEETFRLSLFALVALPFFGEGESAGSHLLAGECQDGGGCHG